MYAVDLDATDKLISEYDSTFNEVDQLLATMDPESTPYKSKYAARLRLDELCNKLEATKTIAVMEHREDVVDQMKWRIAHVKLQIGSISIEVEEPHNAQTDLDSAVDFYFPGLLFEINQRSGELTNQDSKGEENGLNEENISIPQLELVSYPLPSVYLDAMKCLNMLGILWAGRGHHLRALYFFYTAKEFYHIAIPSISSTLLSSFESLFTHNLFYLAQAYGNIGNAQLSCQFCYETLKRQVIQGFTCFSQKLEWIKNASGIADYYLATNNYLNCWYALLSADSVGQTIHQEELDPTESENFNEALINLQRKFIKLDVSILRFAYELKQAEFEGILNHTESHSEVEQETSAEFYPGVQINVPSLHAPQHVSY